MSLLNNNFVSSTTYNSLPHIRDVTDVPKVNYDDLDDLRALLTKHNVPASVCVRLIHKHFDAVDGELMTLREISVPSHGNVQIMGPMEPTLTSQLHGIHYFVDKDGQLQSYEYTTSEAPDMSKYTAFFEEFCHIIAERGLQRKFGLKLKREVDKTGWTEFEFPDKRGTVMIPEGVPLPEGDYEISVATEWYAKHDDDCYGLAYCRHCTFPHSFCHHCHQHNSGAMSSDREFYLGGKKVEPGSPVHSIVAAARKEM
jgi:hypothetical protein